MSTHIAINMSRAVGALMDMGATATEARALVSRLAPTAHYDGAPYWAVTALNRAWARERRS